MLVEDQRLGRGQNLMLLLMALASAALAWRAIRWDAWAGYESASRLWWQEFGGESYSSYKAWFAWRKSWDRAVAAAALSTAGLALTGLALGHPRWRSYTCDPWMLVSIPLHVASLSYFVLRWGPEFRQPSHVWTG
jgi:hypothetical protein